MKMSGKFDGFSQEDISKVTRGTKSGMMKPRGIVKGTDLKTLKQPKSAKESKPSTLAEKKVTKCEVVEEAPQITDDSMSSLHDAIYFRPLSMMGRSKKDQAPLKDPVLQLNSAEKMESNDNLQNRCSPFRGVSLREFESHRRMIEEQNKQKKELLYRAIEVHSQKTAAEAKKIEEIKAELAKLDDELAADVAILRKKIEAACLQYYNLQKQYDKIESQFLKAKMELHNASEKKELLTEHLCTVIAHNEDRKAKKLSELMEKVGISSDGNFNVPQKQ